MTKVCIINGNPEYVAMMEGFGFEVVDDLFSPSFVQFCGGEDVTPMLYDEEPHPQTYFNEDRDKFETEVFLRCIEDGIPMAGICRGAQFLHVMNGGKLWQDVDGHAIGGTHAAVDLETTHIHQVTSTHHQMMRNIPDGCKPLLVANCATSKQCYDAGGGGLECIHMEPGADLEAVFHSKTQSLCFQPHPEFPGDEVRDCRNLYLKYLERYVLSCQA